MKAVRQFLYLDEYKMYSLYSQMFEGFSQSVVRYDMEEKQEAESQKGPVGSGRLIADIAASRRGQEEHRFLNDYAYTLFEEELTRRNMLTVLDGHANEKAGVAAGSMVRITGTAVFNDMLAISKLINTFNDFGAALTYVTTQNQRAAAVEQVDAAIQTQPDRNKRAKLREAAKALTDIKQLAKKSNLHYDEEFLKKLTYLLEFGYGGHFEVWFKTTDTNNRFYSAVLKRECLREVEALIVKKFGRRAEGMFSLVGIASQVGQEPTSDETIEQGASHLKHVIFQTVAGLAGIEATFTGRLPTEFVVDPIAVYREVNIG